jgi:hypothetical protein
VKFNFKIVVMIMLGFVMFGTNSAFAQTTYTINIPTGAADPNAPYFWQSEKDGDASGEIHIKPGDTVNWENADTEDHTVTSIATEEGPDGNFDSGLFGPGGSFKHTFVEEGTFPYHCTVHHWMTGLVVVESAFKVIQNVGDDAGDGSTTFDVEYDFNRVIADARVDEGENAITFTLVGKPQNDDNELTLFLPKDLIDDPYVIWVDGRQLTDFEKISKGGITTVVIPVSDISEQVTIVGSSVVPEFGALSAIVLATAMVAVIFTVSKSKIIRKI